MLMTIAMRPKQRGAGMLDFRLRAAEDSAVYEEWISAMQEAMHFIDPALRDHLIGCHRKVGPLSQHHDLTVIDRFDVRPRISSLTSPLLLIRGMDDPLAPEEYEREIHKAVPGSQYITLNHVVPLDVRPAAP